MILDVFIPGIPKPGGSKQANLIYRRNGEIVRNKVTGRPVIAVRDMADNKDWKATCKHFAGEKYLLPPTSLPLHVDFIFYFTRPKSHYGSGRNAFMVKDSAPPYPAVKPDTTKLVRCAEDALSGVVWIDDVQIVSQTAKKLYSDRPGLQLRVWQAVETASNHYQSRTTADVR